MDYYAHVETTLSQRLGVDWRRRRSSAASQRLVRSRPRPGVGSATKRPIRILMGGYGPATTGFSLALKTDRRSARSEVRRPGRHQVRLQHPRPRLSRRRHHLAGRERSPDARISVEQLPHRSHPGARCRRPSVPVFRSGEGASRHGRCARSRAHDQDRSGDELPDRRLLRKRVPPRLESRETRYTFLPT